MEFVDSSEVEEANGKTFEESAAATPERVRQIHQRGQAEVPQQERALTPTGTTEGKDSEL